MKFWAKLRFKGEKNAEYLIRAFFREFNPESSIVIQGKEAKVEIIFNNKPPLRLIEAINHCDILDFNFDKTLGKYYKDEIEVVEEEISEQIEQVVEEETFKQISQSKKKRNKVVNTEAVNVPPLEEIAKKATSFEHFVKLVAEWLEMDMRQEFFENLVIVGTEIEKISWKELEQTLKDKGIFYSQWDKIWITQQVSKKLKVYSITILPLLNVMVQYKDYSFSFEQSNEDPTEQATEEKISAITEEFTGKVEETTIKKRVKMECMPAIPHFEEALGSIDKTQPIEDRVKHVLIAMGLEKKNAQEQQEIFEIANTAVRLEKMAFDIIFLKANIPMETSINARMTFSKFINDFVITYNSDKEVKLLVFLKQLQDIVMYKSEIESSTDFIDETLM